MAFSILKDISRLDSQIQEIISRNILIHKLLENEFEVAIPVRDCGIDLLVYKKKESTSFKKIQLKSYLGESFSFDKKYLGIKDLCFVFIMNLSISKENKNQIIYGMSMEQVEALIKEADIKPNKKGYFYRKSISKELKLKLNPFELNSNSGIRFFFN